MAAPVLGMAIIHPGGPGHISLGSVASVAPMAHRLEQDIAVTGSLGLSRDLRYAWACDRTQQWYRPGIYRGPVAFTAGSA